LDFRTVEGRIKTHHLRRSIGIASIHIGVALNLTDPVEIFSKSYGTIDNNSSSLMQNAEHNQPFLYLIKMTFQTSIAFIHHFPEGLQSIL